LRSLKMIETSIIADRREASRAELGRNQEAIRPSATDDRARTGGRHDDGCSRGAGAADPVR
jgi:hypothetical protein